MFGSWENASSVYFDNTLDYYTEYGSVYIEEKISENNLILKLNMSNVLDFDFNECEPKLDFFVPYSITSNQLQQFEINILKLFFNSNIYCRCSVNSVKKQTIIFSVQNSHNRK